MIWCVYKHVKANSTGCKSNNVVSVSINRPALLMSRTLQSCVLSPYTYRWTCVLSEWRRIWCRRSVDFMLYFHPVWTRSQLLTTWLYFFNQYTGIREIPMSPESHREPQQQHRLPLRLCNQRYRVRPLSVMYPVKYRVPKFPYELVQVELLFC